VDPVQKGLGIAAGLTAAAIWGGMYVVSKVVLDVIPPFTLLSLRLILGSITLGIFILATTGFRSDRSSYWRVFLVGVVGYGISLGFQFTGTKLSSAANAAMVTSASPAFIFLFGVWLLNERVTAARVAALVLATVGVIIIIDPRAVLSGDPSALGNLLLVGAAVTWGLYSVLVKK
jgi:drug/metabolite transporter (DMT)-like permease